MSDISSYNKLEYYFLHKFYKNSTQCQCCISLSVWINHGILIHKDNKPKFMPRERNFIREKKMKDCFYKYLFLNSWLSRLCHLEGEFIVYFITQPIKIEFTEFWNKLRYFYSNNLLSHSWFWCWIGCTFICKICMIHVDT